MLLSKKLLPALLYILLISSPSFADNNAKLIYEDPTNAQEKSIQQTLKKSGAAASVVALINEKFKLPDALNIVFGGKDGPLYDPETNEILIPYTFINEVEKRFIAVKYADTGVTPAQATEDALMHTLFHEVGHALINMLDLPITGKEEDAVDGLASVLLIEFYEQGQETVISAADLFDLESTDKKTLDEADFWGEHSLDAQRYYASLCHVYGSDPDKYASVLEGTDISDERADLCIEEYETLSRSWFSLLNLQ